VPSGTQGVFNPISNLQIFISCKPLRKKGVEDPLPLGASIVIPQCRLTAVFHEIVRTHQKLEKHLENASQNKC